MRPVGRGCAPLVSMVRRQAGWCGAGTYALSGRPSGNTIFPGCRGIHLLLRGGVDGTSSEAARLPSSMSLWKFGATAPRVSLGQTQTRSFKKRNYVERVTNKEKAEEVLEALEVRDDEKDTQPPRQVLNEKGEESSSGPQDPGSHEEMTKGETVPYYLSMWYLTLPGKMLTTPSRLFKLIIPLTTVGREGEDKGKSQALNLSH